MKIIGICGPSGSGKSTFASLFSKKGIPVLDCDAIYHDLINAPTNCLAAIGKRFGSDVIREGRLDRKALGKIVFSDVDLLNELNKITHRFVLEELSKQIGALKDKKTPVCVIDAPMFFEAGLDSWCDLTCCVIADRETQLARICERDKITRSEAEIRIDRQIKPSELAAKCDLVVKNDGDRSELEAECDQVLKELEITI